MQLPPALRRSIGQELAACDGATLRAAAARLSLGYRQVAESAGTSNAAPSLRQSLFNALSTDELRAAYLAVRVPATFAAVSTALGWTREACIEESGNELRSVLDLGSGPGSALWAAMHVFPALETATAIERDPRIIEMARRLGSHTEYRALREAVWLERDLTATLPEGAWDLVVCSYALNELGEAQRDGFIRQAWARTAKLLVIVEPGTKLGFANVLAVRTRLLASGATLAAPCPNALACPMSGGSDWCHFAARVERTAEHRRLKDATLGHEDEKFSYIAFTRNALSRRAVTASASARSPQPDEPLSGEGQGSPARIVRHPRIFSGYTQLTLCRAGEIANTTITRSKKEDWRRLKRLGWGDRW
jgi:ribosomal protein RSM22 (predicted rRNA methylase)